MELMMDVSNDAFCKDDPEDVASERLFAQQIWEAIQSKNNGINDTFTIVLRNVKKSFHPRSASRSSAVHNLSLVIQRRECFGFLGPNGSGKTTILRLLEGSSQPSSGSIVIAGYNTQKQMASVYRLLGVCPQHDRLWNLLTAREHLLFYGRLKNLKRMALETTVDASLKTVHLFTNAIGDQPIHTYRFCFHKSNCMSNLQ